MFLRSYVLHICKEAISAFKDYLKVVVVINALVPYLPECKMRFFP